jgi:RNA polymerase sigma factor (sigma-70 family)
LSASVDVTRPTDVADDRDLVAGVRAGDDRAFELLFQRYQPRIAAYVRGMVHDHGRAEDITQEVFMSALRRMRAETEREILFKPWIFEIAKNRCIDAFRRGRNTSEVSFDARDAIGADEHGRLAEPGATPDSMVEDKVAIDNLCGAFGGLSPVHHDILVLRELDGLSYREIGERLGLSRPAVESTLFRARKRLSEEYDELVSGRRCLRVQRIVDAAGGRAAGLRDQRRVARHLAQCQCCRRYAGRAGVDLAAVPRSAAAAARIAAFLPLPAFLRRRAAAEDADPLLGHGAPVSQWSANFAAVVDPDVVTGWTKAVATAATVAVAGVGAGAAFSDRAGLAGNAAPRSPFAQAPGQARSGAAASPERSAKRRASAAQPARTVQVHGDPSQPTGRAPTAPPSAARAGARAHPRATADPPLDSDAGGSAATGTGARRESRAPDPGGAVGRLAGAFGAVGTGSHKTAAGDSAKATVDTVVGDVTAATAGVGSVSHTVSVAPPSTTAAPIDLGR